MFIEAYMLGGEVLEEGWKVDGPWIILLGEVFGPKGVTSLGN